MNGIVENQEMCTSKGEYLVNLELDDVLNLSGQLGGRRGRIGKRPKHQLVVLCEC